MSTNTEKGFPPTSFQCLKISFSLLIAFVAMLLAMIYSQFIQTSPFGLVFTFLGGSAILGMIFFSVWGTIMEVKIAFDPSKTAHPKSIFFLLGHIIIFGIGLSLALILYTYFFNGINLG